MKLNTTTKKTSLHSINRKIQPSLTIQPTVTPKPITQHSAR